MFEILDIVTINLHTLLLLRYRSSNHVRTTFFNDAYKDLIVIAELKLYLLGKLLRSDKIVLRCGYDLKSRVSPEI